MLGHHLGEKIGYNFFVRHTLDRITLHGHHTLSCERFCLLLVSKIHHNDRKWTYCVLHLTVCVWLMEILCIMLKKEVPWCQTFKDFSRALWRSLLKQHFQSSRQLLMKTGWNYTNQFRLFQDTTPQLSHCSSYCFFNCFFFPVKIWTASWHPII